MSRLKKSKIGPKKIRKWKELPLAVRQRYLALAEEVFLFKVKVSRLAAQGFRLRKDRRRYDVIRAIWKGRHNWKNDSPIGQNESVAMHLVKVVRPKKSVLSKRSVKVAA